MTSQLRPTPPSPGPFPPARLRPAASSWCAAIACSAVMLVTLVGMPAFGGLVYDEAQSGDLSDDGNNPTLLAVSPGENQVVGQMGKLGDQRDQDLFRFTVPAGGWLTSLEIARYDESPDVSGGSFLAIAAGTTVSTGFGSTQLSNALVDRPGQWLEVLAAGARFGAPSANVTGFSPPLPGGDYVVWFEELGTLIDYDMRLSIQVPEPATAAALSWLLACACGWCAWRRGRASARVKRWPYRRL